MYVGGSFTTPGNNIAQWNGSNWDTLSSGTNNSVYAIGMYKDTVYIGGYFSKAGGHSAGCLAKWEGKNFASTDLNFEEGPVLAIHQYDSLLYISGNFDSTNHQHYGGFISWDGNKPDSVDNFNGWGGLDVMTVFDSLLYFGFGYSSATISYGVPIETWNDSIIGYSGYDYFYPYENNTPFYQSAFCQTDSLLYMGGYFSHFVHYTKYGRPQDTFYLNNIAMWNGTIWTNLGKGINGTVNALVSYNNLIIAGGSFDSAGGIPVNNIAAWNGTKWSALGNGINGTVYTLAVFDSNLYAGGDFSSPGNGIAEFNPTLKITHPVVNNDSVNIFPNPNSGQFTVVCNRAFTASSQPLIEIYNILGEKVYSASLIDGTSIINIENQPTGIYIYRITSAGSNLINSGKLVIE